MWRPWQIVETPSADGAEAFPIETEEKAPSRRSCCKILDIEAKRQVLEVYRNVVQQSGESGALQKTAALTNVPYKTLWRFVKNGISKRKTRKDKGQFRKLADKHADLIPRAVYDLFVRNTMPTLNRLYQYLVEMNILQPNQCSVVTLKRYLKTMGYKYRRTEKKQRVERNMQMGDND